MRWLATVLALFLVAACGPGKPKGPTVAAASATVASDSDNAPAETDPPNAKGQRPAFPGQTRAPALTTNTQFQVVTVAKGLDHPWSLAFLPDGRMLVTERVGRLRIVGKDGQISAPASGVPRTPCGGSRPWP